MSGLSLFQSAEKAYMFENNPNKAFDLYQKAIKKIIKSENVLTPLFSKRPPGLPLDAPSEVLAMTFRNFCGFFRDPAMNFTETTQPEAFRFLSGFRPSSNKEYPRFTSPRAQFLLKCLQISAAMTLGLLAWDAKDRATAAKRYKEALDLAATEPLFSSPNPAPGLETWIANDLRETRSNLNMLIQNDIRNAAVLEAQGESSGNRRKETVAIPNVRVEARQGNMPSQEMSVKMATDACGRCGMRDVKLMKCGRCKKMPYCGVQCQKDHWKTHKVTCTPEQSKA